MHGIGETYSPEYDPNNDSTKKKFNNKAYKSYLETGINVPFPPDLYHLFKLKLKIR
jgi:hypothetical protein